MNEVRQVWTSIRSSKSSRSSMTETVDPRTTWYDLPSPTIVHSRDFVESKMEPQVITNRLDVLPKDAEVRIVEEVVYQNNVEAALNSLSKVCAEPLKADGIEFQEVSGAEKSTGGERRRHSSSVELTATTSLKVDDDGMPRISFSFLGADETASRTPDVIVTRSTEEVVNPETPETDDDPVTQDELYDFPKSTASAETPREALKVQSTNGTEKSPTRILEDGSADVQKSVVQDEWYDVPKSVKAATVASKDEDHKPNTDSSSTSNRILEESEVDTQASGTRDSVLSNCGSSSDLESVDGPPDAQRGIRERRMKKQKRRIGKAWGKMRSWLKEEKTKLGDVVTRHAKLQAVGAMGQDGPELERLQGQTGSYDLTRQRKFEAGSMPRVEEFGLSSVSEEGQASETDVEGSSPSRLNRSPEEDSRESPIEPDKKIGGESSPSGEGTGRSGGVKLTIPSPFHLGKKTKSTENILIGTRLKFVPVSFSMDKLCSDGENEENNTAAACNESDVSKDQNVAAGTGSGGKAPGLIRRRMLGSIRGLMASTHLLQAHEIEEGGQGGFEDVRRYVKQGGDFCKELAAILHERAELEATYAKGLSKLGGKLTKACSRDQGGNSAGGVNEAWRCIGEEMDAAAEAHRVWGIALGEQLAKPLRFNFQVGVAEAQGRSRKVIENSVDKSAKSLQEWRNVAAKSKKQSFACARENERLQDLARIQSMSQGQQNNNKSSNHQMTEKEANKLETRRRKSEDASRRADTEFYTISVRAERARLEYESTIRKGAKQMELLEEERLSALKDLANVYLAHLHALSPRLQQSAERLDAPIHSCNVLQDVEILRNLTRRIDNNESTNAEQLLPDFYAEHVTLAMNRERRKQALVRVLHLIRQDLDREKRGREGLETLHRAFITTPAFAADESTQNVTEKLHHMRSMLTYLEAARYKVGGALSEIEGGKRGKHPLAQHILVSRDRQGLQQSVLKVPNWVRNESLEQLQENNQDELDNHLSKDRETDNRDWADRTAGDGNSENPPDEEDFSDFDEFSNHSEDNNNQDIESTNITVKNNRTEQCRAMYQYAANLNDELSLIPGDLITIHEKQADGWWVGECRGRTGIFPATYVQVIH
ncbi:uncharacterized protein LOC124179427 isoform X1 [Neodiprion fabricii]|uniref:uncharacterized protein LOC124179427 isoform X1 n=1 Tax=Neodiprion fabricii TaxID=2872261 RepID=UPI001ED8DCD0|nr:uncharacterized protein LOC124179427 isoform X1 [Neodiprion fabricii]